MRAKFMIKHYYTKTTWGGGGGGRERERERETHTHSHTDRH